MEYSLSSDPLHQVAATEPHPFALDADLEQLLDQVLDEDWFPVWLLNSNARAVFPGQQPRDLQDPEQEQQVIKCSSRLVDPEHKLGSISSISSGASNSSLPFPIDAIHEADVVASMQETDDSACKLCGVEFRRRHDLQKHIKTIHAEKRGYECHVCLARFKRRHHMENHCRQVHEMAERVACKHCQKMFSTDSSKRRHIRVVHASTLYE
mmetsp:Transcript_18251/g.31625  ORF Transcript_18251/g.31625 Transcript_18251/m.31625 type:complete len:209 (+) Transcript_18251:219-845(+)|eukprot:CAMPEP_0184691934 /NCGR_PEP_ID=MMETSP0313-20130426/619_1 /TAXON_ID=2792 /ORGANISM="Porphyridium aerugineum, Strain SAG 1380-2" /LENGTH=208 /DNA_ID=CAMNT_0027149717 /DNA_START=74 /DNA_END=700 /DNA_ORIENTATION=+